MESTLFVVLRFIDRYKILYDKEEIRLRLMSDPQFPSLLSVANILDYLHISINPPIDNDCNLFYQRMADDYRHPLIKKKCRLTTICVVQFNPICISFGTHVLSILMI